METSLFDYSLPANRIAQSPMEPREEAQLLVLDRTNNTHKDQHIRDLPNLLRAGDLLVFNNSKVFKARLHARIEGTEKKIELFLLRPEGSVWIALAKRARVVRARDICVFQDGSKATIETKEPDGTVTVNFHLDPDAVFALTDQLGEVPLPPYIESLAGASAYQTVYAKEQGSVAAPTAGFHFTESLLATLKTKGINQAFVTLHVGLGTFRPMKTETLEEHIMHEEWASVPPETLQAIEETKKNGGRVIAVGTTATRALESGVTSGFTNLFITPGYQFRIIDGLLTNFHLPKSTLLVLVSSFAGRERILNAYKHALENSYRFYSFGDAMLIL